MFPVGGRWRTRLSRRDQRFRMEAAGWRGGHLKAPGPFLRRSPCSLGRAVRRTRSGCRSCAGPFLNSGLKFPFGSQNQHSVGKTDSPASRFGVGRSQRFRVDSYSCFEAERRVTPSRVNQFCAGNLLRFCASLACFNAGLDKKGRFSIRNAQIGHEKGHFSVRNARIGCKKGCFSAERTDEASACNLHWEEVKELKPSEFAQVLFATYSKPAPKHAGLVKTASVTRHNTRDPGHFDLPAAPRAAQNLRVPSLGTFTSPVRHPRGLRCWTPGTL